LQKEVKPGRYRYTIECNGLVRTMMMAFVTRASGLRDIVDRYGSMLGTSNFSSLSSALRRVDARAFVGGLIQTLGSHHKPRRDDLVAIDGMAVTLPKTRRHACKKMNNNTVGGGVVWCYQIATRKGWCPVQLLDVVQGAWHDSKVMRKISLIARGPVYLMDRGFYAFDLLALWMKQEVRFIVRARRHGLIYQTLRTISEPRCFGALAIVEDVVARLGGEHAKAHPEVRLITAVLASGEKLTVVTSEMDWSAERVLEAYKKRWHIERFHKFLKDTLGLAHLYSFGQKGIEFLTLTALLLAMVLLASASHGADMVIDALHQILRALRRTAAGFSTPWKRNTASRTRAKRKVKNR
jgi:hypothetical protein